MGLDFRRVREEGRKDCFKAKGWLEHVGSEREACRQDEDVHVWHVWGVWDCRPFPGKAASGRGCLLGREGSVRRLREGLESGVLSLLKKEAVDSECSRKKRAGKEGI